MVKMMMEMMMEMTMKINRTSSGITKVVNSSSMLFLLSLGILRNLGMGWVAMSSIKSCCLSSMV